MKMSPDTSTNTDLPSALINYAQPQHGNARENREFIMANNQSSAFCIFFQTHIQSKKFVKAGLGFWPKAGSYG